MGRNGRTLAIPPHSGVGWSCARSGRPRPEARPTPQALRVACAPGGASAREGRPGARPAARPPPLLARPRLGPGPFSLLPERRALSHLRLPARPPRSARLAAGPDPPFRSRHTNVTPQGGNAASCHVSHTAHAVAHLSLPEIILLVSLCPPGWGRGGQVPQFGVQRCTLRAPNKIGRVAVPSDCLSNARTNRRTIRNLRTVTG